MSNPTHHGLSDWGQTLCEHGHACGHACASCRAVIKQAIRCPMVCPHGDRCRLDTGHADGCNHRCPCNEPNTPSDTGTEGGGR